MSEMARGSISKETVIAKILEVFPDAFVYDKTIRIPMIEDGNPLQIKVALTAAKDIVGAGADTAVPGEKVEVVTGMSADGPVTAQRTEMREPTEAEKKNISNLLAELGL